MKNSEKELISVIIPVYNAEKYIDRCLQSIIEQTYEEVEIIVIDDGSTDGSYLNCEEIAERDKRIFLYHKENSGVSATRNMGMDLAKGNYIMFVDADDTLEKECIDTLYNNITGKVDIVCCAYKEIDSKESIIHKLENEQLCFAEDLYDHYLKYVKESYFDSVVWGKLYNKDILKNKRFKQYKYSEDFLFMQEVYSTNPCVKYIDYIGYNYCRNENSAIAMAGTRRIEHIQNELDVRYDIYRCMSTISDSLKNKVAYSYKEIIIQRIYAFKHWGNEKENYEKCSEIISQHIKNVKKITKLSKKETALFFMYIHFRRILWYLL